MKQSPFPRHPPFGQAAGFDAAALEAAAAGGVALCTLVNVEGGFSRAVGAQLAVRDGIAIAGDMTGGCLEAALIGEVNAACEARVARTVRYGQGSPYIDIRLPCGGGVECHIDPCPDRHILGAALAKLERREPVVVSFDATQGRPRYNLTSITGNPGSSHWDSDGAFRRVFLPPPRLLVFGTGPELEMVELFSRIYGCKTELFGPAGREQSRKFRPLFLGKVPSNLTVDRWTAIILLFHEHEWELPIIRWALSSKAFYIGALGGAKTVKGRIEALELAGVSQEAIERISAPVGLISHVKDPRTLGLSVIAEVADRYLSSIRSHRGHTEQEIAGLSETKDLATQSSQAP